MSEQPIPVKPRPDLHTVGSGEEADKNCPNVGGFVMIPCVHCRRKYAIHCTECNQQMTNCYCTLDALTKRHAEENSRLAEKEAWEMKEGLWVPPNQR